MFKMSATHFHAAVIAATFGAAVFLVTRDRRNARKHPDPAASIAEAASTPPNAVPNNLPSYVKENISAWGDVAPPLMPGFMGANTANTADLQYGSYYSE